MPWFQDIMNDVPPRHPPVFFHRAEDFWNWRNRERPLLGGEIWGIMEDNRARALEGQQIVPIPNVPVDQGVMLANFENNLNPQDNRRFAIPAEPIDMRVDVLVEAVPLGDAMIPVDPPKERDWDDLTTDEKLEWLLEQPDPLPIWKEVMDRIAWLNDCIKDEKEYGHQRWNDGYDEGRADARERDDD